jgi:hypothetical protein
VIKDKTEERVKVG